MKQAIRGVAVGLGIGLLVGLCALGEVGVGASVAPTAVSPVGSYTATITPGPFTTTLTLTNKGHFSFASGPHGSWTEKNNLVVLHGQYGGGTYVFRIQQMGRNLGSQEKQGVYTVNGTLAGNWYAIRGTPSAAIS